MATTPSLFTDRKEGPNPDVTAGRHTTMIKPPAERVQKANPDVTAGRHVTNDDGNRSTMTIEPIKPPKPATPRYEGPVNRVKKDTLTTI